MVAALRASGQNLPPLISFAQRVKESLLPVNGGAPSNTAHTPLVLRRPVAELADDSAVIDGWTGRGLADALPNWLTAIGLLTTFIALLLGLQHVKVLANLEVRGIGGLVNGLSGKFFSSIVALTCAVSVSIVNHFLAGATGLRWKRVLERLDELLPSLSTERVFFELSRGRREPGVQLNVQKERVDP